MFSYRKLGFYFIDYRLGWTVCWKHFQSSKRKRVIYHRWRQQRLVIASCENTCRFMCCGLHHFGAKPSRCQALYPVLPLSVVIGKIILTLSILYALLLVFFLGNTVSFSGKSPTFTILKVAFFYI